MSDEFRSEFKMKRLPREVVKKVVLKPQPIDDRYRTDKVRK